MAILAPFPAPLHLKSFIDVHISVHTLFTNPLPSPRCWEWMNSFLLCFFFFCSFPSLMWVLILGTKRINFNSRVSWPSHEWFSCRQTPDAISFDFSFSFYSSVQARGRLWGALCTLVAVPRTLSALWAFGSSSRQKKVSSCLYGWMSCCVSIE